jgi:hypothetical protein
MLLTLLVSVPNVLMECLSLDVLDLRRIGLLVDCIGSFAYILATPKYTQTYLMKLLFCCLHFTNQLLQINI